MTHPHIYPHLTCLNQAYLHYSIRQLHVVRKNHNLLENPNTGKRFSDFIHAETYLTLTDIKICPRKLLHKLG